MRLRKTLVPLVLFASQAISQQPSAPYQDPAGFQLNLPPGWHAKKLTAGEVVATAPNPAEWVMIAPLLAQREHCDMSLRRNLTGGWASFPNIKDLNVRAVRQGLVLADFYFHAGQSRGAVLCADTGPRSGMLYALAAPVGQFAAERNTLLAILRSFRYGGGRSGAAPRPATTASLPLEPWREASENAFTSVKPAGWRVEGGVSRVSNNDVRTGYRLSSPDARASIVLGDVRLNGCVVPGPNGRQFMTQSPGGGKEWCPYRTGEQAAEEYVQRIAGELGIQGLRITNRRQRPDLTAAADRLANLAGPSNFKNATGEVTIAGTRAGVAVTGTFIGNTLMLYSPAQDLMIGNYSRDISGYVGPAEMDGAIANTVARIVGSMQWNMQWVMANRAAGARDTEMVRRYLASQAQLGQQMFENRMAAADRQAAGVGDVLSGTVRLQDADGNKYTARAGSNYYFLDEEQARVARDPNDAVRGRDLWKEAGAVDLRPLEVIR